MDPSRDPAPKRPEDFGPIQGQLKHGRADHVRGVQVEVEELSGNVPPVSGRPMPRGSLAERIRQLMAVGPAHDETNG
jgi:hypothetical protein